MLKHLNITNVHEHTAGYGLLPDLSRTSPDHDILFTYNGTTSGVRVPHLNWISDHRKGNTNIRYYDSTLCFNNLCVCRIDLQRRYLGSVCDGH